MLKFFSLNNAEDFLIIFSGIYFGQNRKKNITKAYIKSLINFLASCITIYFFQSYFLKKSPSRQSKLNTSFHFFSSVLIISINNQMKPQKQDSKSALLCFNQSLNIISTNTFSIIHKLLFPEISLSFQILYRLLKLSQKKVLQLYLIKLFNKQSIHQNLLSLYTYKHYLPIITPPQSKSFRLNGKQEL